MNRTGLLILVFASAAAFFGWETYRAWTDPVLPGKGAPAGDAYSPPSADPAPGFFAGNAPVPGLSSILARPVFRPDRRPFSGASGAVPQRNYELDLSRYTVLGVLLTGDGSKAVVVSNPPGNDARWEVGAGDVLPGFTVKEIGPDGIVLTADEREFKLPLYAGGPKAAGGAPLRTEVGQPSSPAQPPAPQPGRSAPGAGRSMPPAAVAPPPHPQPPVAAPNPNPQITYPRRSIPGRR